MQRRSSTEHRRRSERGVTQLTVKDIGDVVSKNDALTLSEVELHAIKTSFEVIEFLWRDISIGSDHVLLSVLAAIHENLGELGSELFKKHFIGGLPSSAVYTKVSAHG